MKEDFTALSEAQIAALHIKAREYSRKWDHVQIAALVAGRAHEGQRLKSNGRKPYLTHPAHLARQLKDPLDKQVAFLHDVFERSNLEPEDLLAMGIAPEVVRSAQKMTRKEDMLYLDHIRDISHDPRVVRVKIEDICHNTQADRKLTPTDPRKIAKQTAYIIAQPYLEAVRDGRIEPGTPMANFVRNSGLFFKKGMSLQKEKKTLIDLRAVFAYLSTETPAFPDRRPDSHPSSSGKKERTADESHQTRNHG